MNNEEVKVKQIRIDFNVTPAIKRFVYVYIIFGNKGCCLIDSGVHGSEVMIRKALNDRGKDIKDILAIFLTHAHPDHIGSAAIIKEMSGCKVFASKGESPWIEDIDRQFHERPIPNFYNLVNQSVKVEYLIEDGNCVEVEPELNIRAISTPGHSCDELSYILNNNQCIFTGDAIPVRGDIPIWIDEKMNMKSLKRLLTFTDIDMFYPAWDASYKNEQALIKLQDALELMNEIKENVMELKKQTSDKLTITKAVCDKMNTPGFIQNPLFHKTIMSML